VREGLVGLLQKESDIEMVGEASDGQMAVNMAQQIKPNVVIMDVDMPRLNGIEATRQIVAKLPGVRVISLSMYYDAEISAAMKEAGAAALLDKNGPFETLINAIRA